MSRTVLWSAIAETLRADLCEGRYAPGMRLPSEASLTKRFGVTRPTLRRAVARLAGEGLVRGRQGSGVFVVRVPSDGLPCPQPRVEQDHLAAWRTPGRSLIGLQTGPATELEAEALGLTVGDLVLRFETVAETDGRPSVEAISSFPNERFASMRLPLLHRFTVREALQECGVEAYSRAWTRSSATRAEWFHAQHLGLRAGSPILYCAGLNVDESGAAIELEQSWFAGDRVSVMFRSVRGKGLGIGDAC